jgi:hypothetical protein
VLSAGFLANVIFALLPWAVAIYLLRRYGRKPSSGTRTGPTLPLDRPPGSSRLLVPTAEIYRLRATLVVDRATSHIMGVTFLGRRMSGRAMIVIFRHRLVTRKASPADTDGGTRRQRSRRGAGATVLTQNRTFADRAAKSKVVLAAAQDA